MFLLRIGWRNVLRNKKRSFLCALAIAVGLSAIIISDAFTIGMIDVMVENVTGVFLGEGQIVNKKFRINSEANYTVADYNEVIKRLRSDHRIASFAERTMTNAMISTPEDVSNIMVIGVDFTQEKSISQIEKRVIEGSVENFEGNNLIVGKKLMDRLKVRIGEKVILTMAETKSDEIVQELFRVVGVFDLGSKEMNTAFVFIPLVESKKILNISGGHQFILKFKDKAIVEDENHVFWREYSSHFNDALSWKEISPGVHGAINISKYSALIVAGILFIIVSFGIMNTLFMSIFDRLYEFGVLKAIGTKPMRIALMIVSEAISLTWVSIIFSGFITLFFGLYLGMVGIDYTGIEFENVIFTEPIKAVFRLGQFIVYPIIVLIFTTIVSIYPACYAARIKAVNAMKKTL